MFERAKIADWARLAAYIDSEGCIYISRAVKGKKIPHYQLVIHLTNTDPRLLVWIGAKFDGVGCYLSRPVEGQLTRYDWTVVSKIAAGIIKGCLPYFVMKKDQAELALAFQETKKWGRGRGKQAPPEMWNTWQAMYEQLRELKTPPQGKWMERVQ